MIPVNNRAVYAFLGFCLLFLIIIVIFIILINRPSSEDTAALPSPTPVRNSRDIVSLTPNPSIPPVVGESAFTEQEAKSYMEARRRADAAYQNRLRRMPFITKLPYSTARFKIEITAISDTIFITTFGPPNFRDRYREEALNWIRDNDGNPETLTIQYKN